MSKRNSLVVVAIGGNALTAGPDKLTIADQYKAVQGMVGQLADIVAEGCGLLVTHGNGPQVGFILRRSELSMHEVSPVPMDYAGADLQGGIGYMFVKAFTNVFQKRGITAVPVAVVTQTLVDRNDPAFQEPVKPIGSWMDEETAHDMAIKLGWTVREDSGRGWRRVVPSPEPIAVLEEPVIRDLLKSGYVVIAGGGGIPVVHTEQGELIGVEAVIDKDLSSALLASRLKAEALILPTGIEKVALHFNTAQQQFLDCMNVAEAKKFCAAGQFGKGSMEPKVRALISYVERTGGVGVITDMNHIADALAGRSGTRLMP